MKECDIFWGQNILGPSYIFFGGQEHPMIYAHALDAFGVSFFEQTQTPVKNLGHAAGSTGRRFDRWPPRYG